LNLGRGSRLGPYEILALIGAGGMGEVYRARDTRLDRDVAIKVLAPNLSSSSAALARFEREAKAIAALSHPAILAIHDFATHEGTSYAVTELLAGQTLRERLAAGPPPVRWALEYVVQVADGLATAHDKGFVHRDLKPENMFVTTEGRAKILDFGLVRHAPGDSDAEAVTMAPATTPGTVLGTLAYMSPEQAIGGPVDSRSDQFSLGAVLYEMLGGKHPFERPSSAETLSAIIRDEPTPIAALNPGVPVPLRWILERCLSKDPGGRYASTQDLARELRTLLEHLPEATPFGDRPAAAQTGSAIRRMVQHVTSRKLATGAVATVLLILLAAGVYRFTIRVNPHRSRVNPHRSTRSRFCLSRTRAAIRRRSIFRMALLRS
jgi:serine/threonine protein kinase